MKLEPPLRRAGLRSVKNAHLLSFDEYAMKGNKINNLSSKIFYPANFSNIFSCGQNGHCVRSRRSFV